ncbi:hypothetical protein BX67_24065 [Escherichia coli O145:NM str. 2010C-4557C2]|nr:hypothetical protein BX67_24065 [Escherichia coli O145:NM str. 2010C-4557C2]
MPGGGDTLRLPAAWRHPVVGPTPTGSCWRTRQSPPNPLARFRAAATVRCLKNQACSDRSGRAAPVAPETALPAHLTVCKATAPDGAVNPSAATPAACFPLWTFRGLKRPQHGAVAAPSERSTAGRNPEEVDGRRGFRPSGGATGRPGDLIQQKETFS